MSEELLRELIGEVRALREVLERDIQDDNAVDQAVKGVRRAAAVLGVGRDQVRRAIEGLPPKDPRQPARVVSRGGREAPWWPDATSCREWWRELHAVEPSKPPAPRRRRKESVRVTSTKTFKERIDEITALAGR